MNLTNIQNAVEVDGLTVQFGQTKVFSSLGFSVENREFSGDYWAEWLRKDSSVPRADQCHSLRGYDPLG
jgi:hypothetical protein